MKPTLVTSLALLALAQASPLDAQDDEFFDDLDALLEGGGLSEEGPVSSGLLRDWKGFVELRPRAYLRGRGNQKEDQQLLVEAELELDFRLGEAWTAYFRPRLFVDALDTELNRFEPFEAYVTYGGEDWDLRVGQFVENWGIVDTFNPIDVLNRRDLGTDPLDPDRLGELGARLRHTFEGGDLIGEPTLSVYALPVFRETLFAPDSQRLGVGRRGFGFDEDGGFEPDGGDQGLYAVRYQSTLSTPWANADIQALFAHGPSRVPVIGAVAPGGLSPVYYGARTVGAGLRAVPNEDAAGSFLASLTFKAEVVHTDTFSYPGAPLAAPQDYWAYVVGVDRSFYDLWLPQSDLTLTLEYAGDTGSGPLALLRPLRDDLIVRGLYQLNDFARQSIELRALLDLEIDEQIFELIYDRQLRSIHEDLKLSLSAQIFHPAGPGESFYGSLADLTSVAVGLRWDV